MPVHEVLLLFSFPGTGEERMRNVEKAGSLLLLSKCRGVHIIGFPGAPTSYHNISSLPAKSSSMLMTPHCHVARSCVSSLIFTSAPWPRRPLYSVTYPATRSLVWCFDDLVYWSCFQPQVVSRWREFQKRGRQAGFLAKTLAVRPSEDFPRLSRY